MKTASAARDTTQAEGVEPKNLPMFALHWKPKGRIIPSLSIPAKSDKNSD